MKAKAIIMDLDGTLCNADHRLHHIQKSPKDWDTFFSLAHLDEPNEWCLDLINAFDGMGYDIVFLTGRSQREMTLDWLEKALGRRWSRDHLELRLFTRDPHDHRHDNVFKREVIERDILPKVRVMFAVDDRCRVAREMRDMGITVLQCSDWESRAEPSTAEEIRSHFEKKAQTPQ